TPPPRPSSLWASALPARLPLAHLERGQASPRPAPRRAPPGRQKQTNHEGTKDTEEARGSCAQGGSSTSCSFVLFVPSWLCGGLLRPRTSLDRRVRRATRSPPASSRASLLGAQRVDRVEPGGAVRRHHP